MRLTVHVTRDDIDAGMPHCDSCPVTLAIDRALAGAGRLGLNVEFEPYAAFVEARGLVVYDGPRDVAVLPVQDCPDEILDFAHDFDDWYRFTVDHDGDEDGYEEEWGGPPPECCPGPFSFVIDLPLGKE